MTAPARRDSSGTTCTASLSRTAQAGGGADASGFDVLGGFVDGGFDVFVDGGFDVFVDGGFDVFDVFGGFVADGFDGSNGAFAG